MTKVSIIVPIYNVEKYIDKCLKSLTHQTLDDIEIIIVNDGSSDNSQKIIDKYSKKYKNIKAYKKKNGGLSSARNYGLKHAKGEYIGFVDGDDYIEPDMYKKMYTKAITDNLDVVVCDTVNVYPNDKEVYIKSNLKFSDSDIKNYIISPPMACSRLYKRYLFDLCQFKNNVLYEDLNLNPLLILKTKKIGFVEEGLYYYFQRGGSIMNQKLFDDKLLEIFVVLDNDYRLLYKKYPEELEYLYITHLLRSATLRFLEYDSKFCLTKINEIMCKKFPNWRQNIYFKKSSIKFKLVCILAYNRRYRTLKLLKKISKK